MKKFKRILEEDGVETPATTSGDIAKVPTRVGKKKPSKKKLPECDKKLKEEYEDLEDIDYIDQDYTISDIIELLSDASQEDLNEVAEFIIDDLYDEVDDEEYPEEDSDVEYYVQENDEPLEEMKKKKIVWRNGKRKKVFHSTKTDQGFRLQGVKKGGKGGKEKFVSKSKRQKERLHKIIAKRKSKGKQRQAIMKRKRTMRKANY